MIVTMHYSDGTIVTKELSDNADRIYGYNNEADRPVLIEFDTHPCEDFIDWANNFVNPDGIELVYPD